MVKKNKEKKCEHIKRMWCLNDNDWFRDECVLDYYHQEPLLKCVICNKFFEPEK